SPLEPVVRGRRGQVREIPGERGGCGDEGGVLVAVGSQRGTLVAAEEKQLILLDRTADNASKLIPLVCVPLFGEGVAGIEFIVPHELEQIAVKLVATRSRYGVDGRGCVEPILRLHRACLHLEFLERVREWKRHANAGVA